MAGPKPNDADIHTAAEGIFGMLPEDPFETGDGEVEDFGKPEDETPSADAGAGEDHDPEEDAEAANAIRDEEDPQVEADDDLGDEDEEPAEDDDEVDDDEEDDQPSTFTVKVDGQDVEVTERELLDGYSRTASWTRKSQALAEARREFEAERAEVQQERAQMAAALQTVEDRVRATLPEEPSPENAVAWIRYQQELRKLEEVQRERTDLQQRMLLDQQRRKAEIVASETEKLLQHIPEWQDREVMEKEKASLTTYAMGVLGFSVEDIEKVVDHRNLLLLRKAKAYDELKDARGKVKTKAKKAATLKPGKPSRRSKAAKSKAKTARTHRDRLRESGHVKDAAAFIHDTLLEDYE
jgi:hypothetical protein